MSVNINGGLNYTGVSAKTPSNFKSHPRKPTPDDYKFTVGEEWHENKTENIWKFTKRSGTVGTWTDITVGGNDTAISLILTTGDLTLNEGDINIPLGDINLTDGDIHLTNGDLYIDNGGIVISAINFPSTLRTLSDGTVYGLPDGDDGKLLIGAAGLEPAWRNITSAGATVTITNTPNGINLEAAGGTSANTFTTDDASVVTPTAGGNIFITGGANIGTTGATLNTITINLDSNPSFTDLTLSGDLTVDNVIASGNITTSAGNIEATLGSIEAGTTVTSGTTITAGTGLTVTTGGITSSGTTTLSDFTEGALISSATGVISSLNGTDGYFLRSNGPGSVPTWVENGDGTVSSVTGGTNINVTGTAVNPVVNLDASPSLAGSLTVGTTLTVSSNGAGVLISDGSGNITSSDGTNNYVLTSNGTGVVPTWQVPSATYEGAIDTFQPIGYIPYVSTSYNISYDGSDYFMVQGGGSIYKTKTTIDEPWERIYSESFLYSGVSYAYGNGIHYAIKYRLGYAPYAWYSTDGEKWIQINSGLGTYINNVRFVNGYFVAWYTKNGFYYTTDPSTGSWTFKAVTSDTNDAVNYVTYANGYWIATGGDAGLNIAMICYSTTLSGTWNQNLNVTPIYGVGNDYIEWDGTYFGFHTKGSTTLHYSTTISGTFTANSSYGNRNTAAYNNGYWYVGVDSSSTLYEIQYAALANSATWTNADSSVNSYAVYQPVNNLFIAGKSSRDIKYTTDITAASEWTSFASQVAEYPLATSASFDITAIGYNSPNYFILGKDNSDNAVIGYTSTLTDGFAKSTNTPTTHSWDLDYGNGKYVAVGDPMTVSVASTITGIWTTNTTPFTSTYGIKAICYGDNLWAAVASKSATVVEIATAIDPTGIWSLNSNTITVASSSISFLKYINGLYLLGINGTIYFSYDPAEIFEAKSMPGTDITYGNGYYVSIDSSGIYVTKSLSISNTSVSVGFTPVSIAFNNDIFVINCSTSYAYATNPLGPWTIIQGESNGGMLEAKNNYFISSGTVGKIGYSTNI